MEEGWVPLMGQFDVSWDSALEYRQRHLLRELRELRKQRRW